MEGYRRLNAYFAKGDCCIVPRDDEKMATRFQQTADAFILVHFPHLTFHLWSLRILCSEVWSRVYYFFACGFGVQFHAALCQRSVFIQITGERYESAEIFISFFRFIRISFRLFLWSLEKFHSKPSIRFVWLKWVGKYLRCIVCVKECLVKNYIIYRNIKLVIKYINFL